MDKISPELIPFDLGIPEDWRLFCDLCALYYPEVCSPEECREELEDLRDEALTARLIAQTRQKTDPYFVMKLLHCGDLAGFLSFSFWEKRCCGVLNNLYIVPRFRSMGLGAAAVAMAEDRLARLGARSMELFPVPQAEPFYRRLGYVLLRTGADGEPVYGKPLRPQPPEGSSECVFT